MAKRTELITAIGLGLVARKFKAQACPDLGHVISSSSGLHGLPKRLIILNLAQEGLQLIEGHGI